MKTMIRCTSMLAALAAMAGLVQAQVEPERTAAVAAKEFRHADLDVPAYLRTTDQLPGQAAAQARQSLARLGGDETTAFVDLRSGRFETLISQTPLVPGVGNSLRWADVKAVAPESATEREQAVRDAFLAYLNTHQEDLRIDLGEVSSPRVTVHEGGALYHVTAARTIDGIPVRGSYVSATLNHGNLVLLGIHSWGDTSASSGRPRLSADEALSAAEGYLEGVEVTGSWGESELLWVPMARGQAASEVALGQGYRNQLVWSVKLNLADDGGTWELLVDAGSGEVLANEDRNHYADAVGGVYPVTNDLVAPDGVEQAGWPMPFLTVGSQTTDTGGNLTNGGSLTASLSGPYVLIADNCGSISLTQTDNLDFGTSSGTDCTTPGFGGNGNTHAARSGFYELNKIKEMARGQLPSNTWLQGQLRANMNINNTCNAFWSAGTVNFYRSGGGCYNTGEIAAVFDHEWGHGMDQNDSVAGISSPSGEGIADLYAALRLNTSCIGRHFRDTVCTGFGDPCLTCTGVRDIDYLMRQSGQPHDFSWSNANCGTSVHCKGGVYSEAVWSLWKRLLQAAPYNMDENTSHEVVTRLTFLGGGSVGTWFSGSPPWGGCGSTSGYLKYLTADDDNGNLNDGTPHMTAIYTAFNDQEIACNTLTVQDSGCANTPTSAPSVTATAGNKSVSLSWSAVANATKYQVFRTEGVFACDFGKVKLGETTGTTWNDSNLRNGRQYSYIVIPIGAANTCFGPSSSCTSVTPQAAPQCSVAADCNDGIACTADACNAGTCVNTPNNGACDNGLFCDGAETCDAILGCVAGSDPCPGQACDEAGDSCIECSVNADCDDGLFCNGFETCSANSCQSGSDPCPGQNCDEALDQCFTCAPSGASCASNGDCCSGNCKGKPGSQTCK